MHLYTNKCILILVLENATKSFGDSVIAFVFCAHGIFFLGKIMFGLLYPIDAPAIVPPDAFSLYG